jgi:hypothetical protein
MEDSQTDRILNFFRPISSVREGWCRSTERSSLHALRWALCVAVGLGVIAAVANGADDGSPEAAARDFYAILIEHRVSGLPDDTVWPLLKQRVTPELARVIEAAQREQADFIKRNPDEKPPWIEGDLFSSLFEGPQEFSVGGAKIVDERAEVPVSFVYRSEGETTKWQDTLVLTKSGTGWQVADVNYGGTWEFGNKGTLLKGLRPGGAATFREGRHRYAIGGDRIGVAVGMPAMAGGV